MRDGATPLGCMTPLERATEILISAKALVEEISSASETFSISAARELYPLLREAEGWLQGARSLLDPTVAERDQ